MRDQDSTRNAASSDATWQAFVPVIGKTLLVDQITSLDIAERKHPGRMLPTRRKAFGRGGAEDADACRLPARGAPEPACPAWQTLRQRRNRACNAGPLTPPIVCPRLEHSQRGVAKAPWFTIEQYSCQRWRTHTRSRVGCTPS